MGRSAIAGDMDETLPTDEGFWKGVLTFLCCLSLLLLC